MGRKLFSVKRDGRRIFCASCSASSLIFSSAIVSTDATVDMVAVVSARALVAAPVFSSSGGGFFLSRNSLHSTDPRRAKKAAPRPSPSDTASNAKIPPPIFADAPERSGVLALGRRLWVVGSAKDRLVWHNKRCKSVLIFGVARKESDMFFFSFFSFLRDWLVKGDTLKPDRTVSAEAAGIYLRSKVRFAGQPRFAR